MERFPILRISEGNRDNVEDMIAKEFPLTIILNEKEIATLFCTPKHLKYLAVGFLSSKGFIQDKDDIKKMAIDAEGGIARVETKQDIPPRINLLHPHAVSPINSKLKIPESQIFSLMDEFQCLSPLFRITGGVHSAALCDPGRALIHDEDIGRHNALDKIFGRCILEDIPTDNRIVISSGRVSSEILLKVVKINIPIILSISAPTDLAVRLADSLGVTLVGFIRVRRMNVYTNGWRVETG